MSTTDKNKPKAYSYKQFLVPKPGTKIEDKDNTTITMPWPEYFDWLRMAGGKAETLSRLMKETAEALTEDTRYTWSEQVRAAVLPKLQGSYRPQLVADWKESAVEAEVHLAAENNAAWNV